MPARTARSGSLVRRRMHTDCSPDCGHAAAPILRLKEAEIQAANLRWPCSSGVEFVADFRRLTTLRTLSNQAVPDPDRRRRRSERYRAGGHEISLSAHAF